MTAAVEGGVEVLVFGTEAGQQQASSWQKLARFKALHRRAGGLYDGDSQVGSQQGSGPASLGAGAACAGGVCWWRVMTHPPALRRR
jgi:hypothetical protein